MSDSSRSRSQSPLRNRRDRSDSEDSRKSLSPRHRSSPNRIRSRSNSRALSPYRNSSSNRRGLNERSFNQREIYEDYQERSNRRRSISPRRRRSYSRSRSPIRRRSRSPLRQQYRDRFDDRSKLFIGGLSFSTDDESLKKCFQVFGDIVESKVIMDQDSKSRGFGFVTFSQIEDSEAAKIHMNGKELDGRPIRVDHADRNARGRAQPGLPYSNVHDSQAPKGTFSGERGQYGEVIGGGGMTDAQRADRMRLREESRINSESLWERSPSPPSKRETKPIKLPTQEAKVKEVVDKAVLKTKDEEETRRKTKDEQFAKKNSEIENMSQEKEEENQTNGKSQNNEIETKIVKKKKVEVPTKKKSKSSTSSKKGKKSSHKKSKSSNKRNSSKRNKKKSSRKKSNGKKRKKRSYSSSDSDSDSDSSSESDSSSDSDSSEDDDGRISKKAKVKNKVEEAIAHRVIDALDAEGVNEFKTTRPDNDDDDDDEDDGPQPMPQAEDTGMVDKNISYGGALLPGEGAAIAQFVQKNMRIPRRGEVGWNGQEIEKLEDTGYVMSGSRHARMNAIRIRKENQVYSAEEKRALALIQYEEQQQAEAKIMNDFREMLTERQESQRRALAKKGIDESKAGQIADRVEALED